MLKEKFSDRLLAWFKLHGRHDLPWQLKRTPYRVWVSEIMLQQTQVATVIPYFNKFQDAFPDVVSLAEAKPDAVLHYWTGLGYYARARNMHKAANIIVEKHQGRLPTTIKALTSLPGIGRSTAGAILALACGLRHPVLDGNVKRVLSRYHGVAGAPSQQAFASTLWSYAEQHTPDQCVSHYTQAIMDLGATLCTRNQPDCVHCPLKRDCFAHKTKRQHEFPGLQPKAKLPHRETIFAIIENSRGQFLLEQRPASGIWGGLWCFPEFVTDKTLERSIFEQYGYRVSDKIEYKNVKHTFTHFHLLIRPVHVKLKGSANRIKNAKLSTWLSLEDETKRGFPAPVVAILKGLHTNKRTY